MSRSEGQPLLGSINQAMPVAVAGGESNLFSSVVNLTNTILGAGLLAIPFAFRLSGLGLGLGFLAFIWLASALSFDVLGRAAQLTGLYTYKEIAARSCGKPLAIISELCILLYTFLSLVSRPIILSQYLVTVFASWTSPNDPAGVPFILTQRWFFITVVLVIIYPLTFLRNIDALKCEQSQLLLLLSLLGNCSL
jgi:sodium-coupled neutral amino acid transporter 11